MYLFALVSDPTHDLAQALGILFSAKNLQTITVEICYPSLGVNISNTSYIFGWSLLFTILVQIRKTIQQVKIFIDLGGVDAAWKKEVCVTNFPFKEIGWIMEKMQKLRSLEWTVQTGQLNSFNFIRDKEFQTEVSPLWMNALQNQVAAMCQLSNRTIDNHTRVVSEVSYVWFQSISINMTYAFLRWNAVIFPHDL